jgi:hypothetical protein
MSNATAVLWFHVSGRSGLRFVSDARVERECDEHRVDQELAGESPRIGPSNIETLLSMWNDNGSGGVNAFWFFAAVRRVELLQ